MKYTENGVFLTHNDGIMYQLFPQYQEVIAFIQFIDCKLSSSVQVNGNCFLRLRSATADGTLNRALKQITTRTLQDH